MKVTDDFMGWIRILRERPKMIFTGKLDSYSFKTYLQGYIHGISHGLGIDLTEDITTWLKKKTNQPSSLFWADQILFLYKDKSEDEVKLLLLQTLENFLMENPGWHNGNKAPRME